MTATRANVVLRHIRDIAAAEGAGRLDDRQLLQRFTSLHEEAAFAALVRRHGPLVLGVCRRVLHDPHDAEDAFQATFLALARRAASVGHRASLGTWLYRVAYHAALRARRQSAVRRQHEDKAPPREQPDPLAEVTGRELLAVLDKELHDLPERLRAPLVLCYLEGKARDEAARALGWSLGTLKRRLEQGRAILHARLAGRGLSLAALLAAGLAGAAVSPALAAATLRVAAGRMAIGAVPSAVTELTEGVLHGATLSRIKMTVVLLLGAAVVGLGAVPLASPREVCTPAMAAAKAPAPPAEKPAPPASPPPAGRKEMTVTGRVLGPDGKPVAGADVAVLAWQTLDQSGFEDAAWKLSTTTGRTKADADGKFRLTIKTPAGLPEPKMRVLAGAKGLGIAWASLGPKAESAVVELRLPAEQVVRGRIVDLQGEPVAGARVVLTDLRQHPAKGEKDQGAGGPPPEGLPFGPVNTTADAKGDFTFRGLGNNLTAEFEVHDDRVELHTFTIETSDKKQAENVKLPLPPGRVAEGRVTYADTGKPVPGARVMIETPGGRVRGLTDKEGRYHLNVRPFAKSPDMGGPRVIERVVFVFPPPGEPYWMKTELGGWEKGTTRHETNAALPRGVLLRGKITEAGSGKPVAGAAIEYHVNQLMHNKGVSGADGSYAFAVPAGATGPLTVNGPTADYVPRVIGSAEILAGKKGGDRVYYDAVVPLGIKPGDKEKELPITLRRGVTIKGRVVGADGKPAKDAILLVGEYKPPRQKVLHPVRVREGQFELPGCDPDKTYHLVFIEHPWLNPSFIDEALLDTYGQMWLRELLGPQVKFGVAVDVSAKKAAAEPVEVRLAACGSAKVRFVDGDGKPLAKHKPWFQLVVTDGPPVNQALKDGKFGAEVMTLFSQYPDEAEPHADADGVLILEGLVPGATYRMKKAFEGEVIKEFKVESGKALELTVTVK